LGKCPVCGKNFEAHATVGPEKEFKVGDVVVCIRCATVLILVTLPASFESYDPKLRRKDSFAFYLSDKFSVLKKMGLAKMPQTAMTE
jgi:hypothetical protein